MVVESDDVLGVEKDSSHFTSQWAKRSQQKLPAQLISDVSITNQIEKYNDNADEWRHRLDLKSGDDIDAGRYGACEE